MISNVLTDGLGRDVDFESSLMQMVDFTIEVINNVLVDFITFVMFYLGELSEGISGRNGNTSSKASTSKVYIFYRHGMQNYQSWTSREEHLPNAHVSMILIFSCMMTPSQLDAIYECKSSQ